MDKKIITIAEISMALAFVFIMAMICANVLSFGNKSNDQLSNIKASIEDAELESYDGSTVSGDTVISTINKMQESKSGIKMCYGVKLKSNTDWNFYGTKNFGYSDGGSSYINSNGDAISGLANISDCENFDTKQFVSTKYNISTEVNAKDTNNKILFISPVQEFKSTLVFNTNGVLVGMIFVETEKS